MGDRQDGEGCVGINKKERFDVMNAVLEMNPRGFTVLNSKEMLCVEGGNTARRVGQVVIGAVGVVAGVVTIKAGVALALVPGGAIVGVPVAVAGAISVGAGAASIVNGITGR